MELLDDLRKLFARGRKGSAVELNAPESDAAERYRDAGDALGTDIEMRKADARPWRLRPVDENRAELAQLIAQHTDLHRKFDALADRLGGLRTVDVPSPDVLQALLETSRQNAQALQSINDRFSDADSDDGARESAIEKLRETVRQQADVLGLLQQQLDSNGRSASRLVDALDTLHPTLSAAAADGKQINKLLTEISAAAARRDEEARIAMARVQRLAVIGVIAAAVAAAAAITAVIVALI